VLGFAFREVMAGSARIDGAERPFRFRFRVEGPTLLRFLWRWHGDANGTVTLGKDERPATGTLDIEPIFGRIIYRFDFGDYHFEGRKKIRLYFFGWTTLRGSITDASGKIVAPAIVRFSYLKHFLPLIVSFRAKRRPQPAAHG
jgi:hypothetical protein